MRAIIRLLQAIESHMRVNLRGNQVRVPEQFLDAPKVCAAVEKMRGVTVPQFVRGQSRVEADASEVLFQTFLHDSRRDGAGQIASRPKNGLLRLWGGFECAPVLLDGLKR